MSATVLVISNDQRHSLHYTAGLTGYGFDIETTRTHEAARALIRTGLRPQAIIIDLKFNNLDLSSFVNFLRFDMKLTKTRIIMMGGTRKDEHAAFSAYADHFFYRPVDLNMLVSTFQHVS